MKSLFATVFVALFSLTATEVASATDEKIEKESPSCECECPSLEQLVEERMSDYKAQVEKSLESIEKSLTSELTKERVEALRKQLEDWVEELRKDLDKEPQTTQPHERQI